MSTIVLLPEFTDYARDQVGAVDEGFKQAALDAAESMIQEHCNRAFFVASSSSARSYTPNGWSEVLRIHDCTQITSVVDDGNTITSYQPEPLNGLSWSGEARPYEQLRRTSEGVWTWDDGTATVVVTAKWGWAAIPSAVVEAVKITAKDILQQRNNNSGVAGFGDFGAVRVRLNPFVLQLLAPYRRLESYGMM